MASRWQKLKFHLMLRAVGFYKHMTLGARCAVIVDGRVLLVRHGYVAGWQLPGGGVDPGETSAEAARREVLEETGFAITGPLRLVGLYHNTLYGNRDHVALFHAQGALAERAFVPGYEIREIGWFVLDDLPEETSPATLRRLAEVRGEAEPSAIW